MRFSKDRYPRPPQAEASPPVHPEEANLLAEFQALEKEAEAILQTYQHADQVKPKRRKP